MSPFKAGEILYRKASCQQKMRTQFTYNARCIHFKQWPTFIRVTEVTTFPFPGVRLEGVAMKAVSLDSTKVHVTLDEPRQASQDQLVQQVFGLTLPVLHIETINTFYLKCQRSPKADYYVVNTDVLPDREINFLQTTTIKKGFDLLPYFPTDLVNEIGEFCLRKIKK